MRQGVGGREGVRESGENGCERVWVCGGGREWGRVESMGVGEGGRGRVGEGVGAWRDAVWVRRELGVEE